MGALAPGFRFCPTDEELLIYYLRPKAWGKAFHQGTIAEVDIYKFEPWDLPDKSALSTKDPEWYFFSTQDKKYSHTARINRTTARGYWKATGKDRKVYSGPCIVGLKKTLIYYEGRAPNGHRTNWIMHEFRLDYDSEKKEKGTSVSVLCRIRKKGGPGPRNGEQYGAPVCNEGYESDEDSKSGKLSVSKDARSLEGVNVEGGNAFDLQKQVEGLRSVGPVKVEPNEVDSGMNFEKAINSHGTDIASKGGMMVCENDLYDVSKSTFDTSFCDKEDPLSCFQPFTDFQDMGTPLDSEFLPVLPTLTDFDSYNLQDYAIRSFDEPEILGEMWSLVNESHGAPGSRGVDNKMVAPQLIIDGNLHDYVTPAFDQPEILGEMWSLVNDNYGGPCSRGVDDETVALQFRRKVLPEKISHVVGGDYIELDDIEAPLGGFALRSPIHDAYADSRPATTGFVQEPLTSQGAATRRVHLQVPASCEPEERVKNVVTSEHPTPQVAMHIHGGSEDKGIQITRESYSNNGVSIKNIKSKPPGFYYGANFKSCKAPHAVESSTRSYLSKHMSTYAVSKFEIAPPQPCYASLTDNQDSLMAVIEKTDSSTDADSSTDSFIKDEYQIDNEKAGILPAELCYASLIDIQDGFPKVHKESDSSTTLRIKDEIDGDSLVTRASCSLDGTASSSLLTKGCRNSENAVNQGHNPEVKLVNISSSRRCRLRASLREIKNKLKQSALGVKFIQLEEGMRTKLSDRLHMHGKSSDAIFPSEDETNDFDRLKNGLLAILYYLATAAFILSCLFWGYHIVTKYASCVSVQEVI